jgi:predicted dienelactone hydrolase
VTSGAHLPLLDVVLPVAALPVAFAALRTARHRRRLRMPIAGRMWSDVPGAVAGLGVLLAALAAQLTLADWRWQLVPVAAGTAMLGLVLVLRVLGREAPLAGTTATVTLLGSVTSLALSWALPVQVMPVPAGPYAVGTTTIVLTDPDRTERYGPTPGGPRELVVQVWYPAAPDAPVERAPLIPQAAAFVDLGAAELGLPRFALGHLGLIRGNATLDVPKLDARSPVALLAHGWTGFRTIQSDLAEQLASEGWIVAAADHRFGALVATFPDGRADLFDPEALPEFGTVPADLYATRSRALVATFADDLALVLRTLVDSPPAVLEGRVDASRVAMLGHSTGGGAAIQACATEPRCAAVVGFDPWVEPVDASVLATGTSRPLLSLRTEDWAERPNEAVLQELHRVQRSSRAPEGLVRIDGALHRDFTLIGALSPASRLLGFAGDTPSADTRTATLAWTSRFLAHHVLGAGPDPLREPPATRVGVLEPTP